MWQVARCDKDKIQKSMIKMKPFNSFNLPGAASSSLWCSRRFSVRIRGTQQFRCQLFWWAGYLALVLMELKQDDYLPRMFPPLFGGTLPPKNGALKLSGIWGNPDAVPRMGAGTLRGLEMFSWRQWLEKIDHDHLQLKIWHVGWMFLVLYNGSICLYIYILKVCLEWMDMDDSLDGKMFCFWNDDMWISSHAWIHPSKYKGTNFHFFCSALAFIKLKIRFMSCL